jgi:hypothetical protein
MENAVSKVLNHKKKAKLQHPKGIRLTMGGGTFLRDVELDISQKVHNKSPYGQIPFKLSSTETSVKTSEVSIKVNYRPDSSIERKTTVPFIEIKESDATYLVAGTLVEKAVRDGKEYFVVAECEPFRKELDVVVGGGVFVFPERVERVFHPVQHQFKIHQDRMQEDATGNSRRSNADGSPCDSPAPVDIHPACYPASWAALCNSYRMTPAHPRRQWEIGTPTQPNPPPDEYGDSFSTWVMGGETPGSDPHASRVEDWQADPDSPTPIDVVMETVTFPTAGTATQIANRADLIKSTLLREVGGYISPIGKIGNGRPVRMAHRGHAWLVVGVDDEGYWDHAPTDADAWAFSNYCRWVDAPWVSGANAGNAFWISYPQARNTLRPENKRLGCINFEGSGDAMPRIRILDAYTHSGVEDTQVINWMPHTRSDSGYLWTYQAEPLTCEGFPKTGSETELGRPIPRPPLQRDSCGNCGNATDGCSHCRTRLLLPFWVHNTTLDELVTYKLDLYLFNKDQRWVSIRPELVPESRGKTDAGDLYLGFSTPRWGMYNLPGSLPGDRFSIQAVLDSNSGKPRTEPWNSQGFGWFIDFQRDQLTRNGLYGIRMVLSCSERSGEPVCLVQDIKQLWFSVADPTPF